MALEIVIPEANVKGRTTKDLVFSILTADKQKTLTQLHREIKRKYGVSVTFQAVLKAVRSLLDHNVISRKGKLYSLNEDWIFETRNFFDDLYRKSFGVKKPVKKVELGRDVTVYTLSNLLELDRLWYELLMNWSKKERTDKRNCWKGRHAWWVIPRLQEEDVLHDFMIKKGIKTYNLWTSNTLLDRIAAKYYSKKKENVKIKVMKLSRDTHIATFGENVIKFEIPKKVSDKLERIFQKTKKLEDLDIKKAIDVFKENTEIEFTVIKDKMIADKVKEDIVGEF
ncbi:hypothetical protein ACFL96_04145 [Thermoproteota archaeon]